MKKILILANDIDWVYSLRKELIEKLIETKKVIVCIPECGNSFKLNYFINLGVKFEFVNYQRRGANPFKDFSFFVSYFKVIKKLNPDIILTYTIKPNIYGTYIAALLNKPVIINITGVGTTLTNSRLKYIVIKLYRLACLKSTRVFFQNQNNYSLFITNNIVDAKKCEIIPGSGVNLAKYKPTPKVEVDETIKFLFIGRIMKEKGIEEYLEAAKQISEKIKGIEFQIIGPFIEDKYKEIILNNKLKNIKYLGKSNDVRIEIREANCIVNPSYHEGMSNVLLEGAAMEKPLIASDIPGCKEIIDYGKNGYLFKVKSASSLEEKLVKFIKLDKHQKNLMGKESRNKVETEFDRNIVVKKYLDAINKILNMSE